VDSSNKNELMLTALPAVLVLNLTLPPLEFNPRGTVTLGSTLGLKLLKCMSQQSDNYIIGAPGRTFTRIRRLLMYRSMKSK
jgi:hypothetical protein